MSTHSPFPWTAKKTTYGSINILDANGIKFGNVFSSAETRRNGQDTSARNAELFTAIPGLLMAAMRGHGWGDPLHIEAYPACTMCHAIRIAVGERTAKRVMELAAMHSDHILELLEAKGASDEENWEEVERLLGIANGDPYSAALRAAGEYEGMAADIIEACSNA